MGGRGKHSPHPLLNLTDLFIDLSQSGLGVGEGRAVFLLLLQLRMELGYVGEGFRQRLAQPLVFLMIMTKPCRSQRKIFDERCER